MPLDVPQLDPCPLCTILARRRPYAILDENPLVAMLVTHEQRGLGHVLVIPTQHRETILDLTDEEARWVMDGTVRAAHAIAATYDPPAINVWQNNGVPAQQSVPHLHVHVTGTADSGADWGDVPSLDVAETERIAAKLRPHLAPTQLRR